MDQHRLLARGITFSKSEKAILEAYKITFNKKAYGKKAVGYCNIVKDKRYIVEGVLYTINSGIENLDTCEGFPNNYDKKFIWVKVKRRDREEEEKALIYIAAKNKIKKGLKPERSYIYHLIEGAKQHDLSSEYIRKLEAISTTE